MSEQEKTRTTKNTLDRQRASAGRVYLQKLQKSCKKAITEAFTNYPALAVVTKGLEIGTRLPLRALVYSIV